MMSEIKGKVHSIESFGLVDGPGVRCAIFLQGCHMRCQYCHNPDTWNLEGGQQWSALELFQKIIRFRSYWKEDGGVTISGGEAFLQMEFIIQLFQLLKADGINTCIDTSANPFSNDPVFLEKFDQLMELTDLFILDIKEMDDEKHKKLTGHTNKNILAFARYLSDHKKDIWIRHVLVPGLTDDEKGLKDLADFIKGLTTVKKIEILPYHTLGVFKWKQLGLQYPLEGVACPTKEEVKKAENILFKN